MITSVFPDASAIIGGKRPAVTQNDGGRVAAVPDRVGRTLSVRGTLQIDQIDRSRPCARPGIANPGVNCPSTGIPHSVSEQDPAIRQGGKAGRMLSRERKVALEFPGRA